jgi:putative transposase
MISFKGRQFLKTMILMSVRWYLAYSLSYRNIEELMLERGVSVDHSTVNRWVIHYSPQLLESFKKKKNRVGRSWRMDETYIKIKGIWHYLYRAIDHDGDTLDFMLSKRRDKKSATKFFKKSIKSSGKPIKINIDKSGSNKAGIEACNRGYPKKIKIRQVKYLNNRIEQDHRFIKRLSRPMMGFKSFPSAAATLSGIELHHMIKKGQMKNTGNKNIFEQFYALAA